MRPKILLPLTLAATLAACASTPPPQSAQTEGRAKQAVQAAIDQDARRYAPDLLEQAENKIVRAENAQANGDLIMAAQMMEEALVDARLAAVRSDLTETQLLVRELENTISLLEQEINR